MEGYTIQQVAAAATEHSGRAIGNNVVTDLLRSLRQFNGRFPRGVLASMEERQVICEYLARFYHRREKPAIRDFCLNRDGKIPVVYAPPAPVEKKVTKSKKNTGSQMTSQEIRDFIRKELKQYSKSIISEVKQLEGPVVSKKARESDLEPVHKRINSFCFKEPIEIDALWRWIQNLFEERNGIKVYRVGNQSFPQWLHSSSNLELFKSQLQGFLDFIHDELHGDNAQGKLL